MGGCPKSMLNIIQITRFNSKDCKVHVHEHRPVGPSDGLLSNQNKKKSCKSPKKHLTYNYCQIRTHNNGAIITVSHVLTLRNLTPKISALV